MVVIKTNGNYEVVKCSKKARLTIVPFMYKILTKHPDAVVNFIPEDLAAICEIVNNKTILYNPITKGYIFDDVEYGNALDVFNTMKSDIVREFLDYFLPNGIPVFTGKKHGLKIDEDNLMSMEVYLRPAKINKGGTLYNHRRDKNYTEITDPYCFMYNDSVDIWFEFDISDDLSKINICGCHMYRDPREYIKTTMAEFVMDKMRCIETRVEIDRINATYEAIDEIERERTHRNFMNMDLGGHGGIRPNDINNGNININVTVNK